MLFFLPIAMPQMMRHCALIMAAAFPVAASGVLTQHLVFTAVCNCKIMTARPGAPTLEVLPHACIGHKKTLHQLRFQVLFMKGFPYLKKYNYRCCNGSGYQG
mmetsp:Transcript_73964/g.146613  ORF Transcript_73964/g.146613 Transcript_73964/m.146613 type:complete len:102 (+) Transcript_73964:11-316(+)